MTKNNNKLKTNQTYLGILTVQNDGKLKVVKAQQLNNVNQYKSTWQNTDSRRLARILNRAEYLIK